VARAERVLSWGAEKVIVGSAAFRNEKVHHAFLRRLRDRVGAGRVILALDAERGDIVIRGWRRRLAVRPEQVMPELEPYCSEFLCTCVHREGRMRGTDLAWYRKLREVTSLPVTAAGGIRSRLEVRRLGAMGMRSAVGMALYTGQLA
jgi:phosphoribosylformimino-5-aminoimidazole carboxamide ribonucleotide (ProFAR) isomerase